MKAIKGKKMYLTDNTAKNVLYILLAAVILSVIGYGTYTYATHLKQDIERKKEIQRLENQKLRLEIEILKKANGS
jgi:hypothetical protein